MIREKQFVTVNGVQIYCEFINKHLVDKGLPLLIFLHEGLGSIRQWKNFPDVLASRLNMPVLLFDRQGYGLSDKRDRPFDSGFLHDEALLKLPELLDALSLSAHPTILIGHSDGATIALMHAAVSTGEILGIVSEAAHVMVEEITTQGILGVCNEYKKGKTRELLWRYHGDKTDELVEGWTTNWLSAENRQWNIDEYLPRITCPVLIIQGTNDHFGTFAQVAAIRDSIKGTASVLYLDNCGHIPHLQAPDTITGAITDFINHITNK